MVAAGNMPAYLMPCILYCPVVLVNSPICYIFHAMNVWQTAHVYEVEAVSVTDLQVTPYFVQ